MKPKIYIFILVIMLVTSFVACSTEQIIEKNVSEDTIKRINAEETYPEVPGELQIIYDNITNIILDANDIVKIKVLEQGIDILDGYPQTNTVAEICYVSKGNLKVGDKITIVEEGGINGKVLGGMPQLNNKSDYVLFLTEYNGKYYILGAFQGRFIEREGYLFQQATIDVKLSDYKPITTEGFLKMIEKTLK